MSDKHTQGTCCSKKEFTLVGFLVGTFLALVGGGVALLVRRRRMWEAEAAQHAPREAPPPVIEISLDDEPIIEPVAPAAPEAPLPTVEPPAEPAAAEQPKADDLTRLEGIGAKVSALLQENGITTYAALAAADVAELTKILRAAHLPFMTPAAWPEQARLMAEGRLDELAAFQSTLRAGRK